MEGLGGEGMTRLTFPFYISDTIFLKTWNHNMINDYIYFNNTFVFKKKNILYWH